MTAAVIQTSTPTHHCQWAGQWVVDAGRSSLQVSVKVGVFATAHGRFTDLEGDVELCDRPQDSAVEVTVATASLTSGSSTMDAMLRGAGIVDCAANPTLTFRARDLRPTRHGWELEGDLLTAGGTLPLTLQMDEPEAEGDDLRLRARGAIASADAVRLLSRPGLGALLGRTMTLDLQIVLVRC